MDKYKVILKIEETKRLASVKKYKEAYEEMKYLNLAKMKNYEDLIIFADIYVRNKKYVEAKELLERLHTKTVTRRLLTQLIFVSAKTKNFVDAEKYYEEYVKIAPKDINKYVLRYRIDKEKGLSKEILIKTLEELKEYDYVEEWAYELAKLYHKAGKSKECIRECSNIELWFGDGIIVEKAKLLREHHINALSEGDSLGKLSNEAMDFTATGKLIDLLGIVPQTVSEEDEFADTAEFEKDNDKIDDNNKKVLPEANEEGYNYTEETSGEIAGDFRGDMVEIISDDKSSDKLSDEQLEELFGRKIEDTNTHEESAQVDEEFKKIITNEAAEKSKKKHNSIVEAFKSMISIKDYDQIEDDVEDEEEEIIKEANDLPEDEVILEQPVQEKDSEIEQGEAKVELTDADFDPEVLELERIIAKEKSKKDIENQAKDLARDIRKDLASEISVFVEEEEKVKSEFKEDMEQLDAMATKRIVSVSDILSQLDENNGTIEEELKEEEPKHLDEVEPEETEDTSKPEETETTPEPEYADAPQPIISEEMQKENIEQVLSQIEPVDDKNSNYGDEQDKAAGKKEKFVTPPKELFRNYAENEYLNSALTKAFSNVLDNKKCANFIISGDKKTGKSTLAKMITKHLKNIGAVSTGKVARIDATRFNNVDLELKQDSLCDCCLIINNAHEISPYAITGLISMLIKFNGRTMVILETNQSAEVILDKTSEVGAYFSNVITMPKYSVQDLIMLGHSYSDLNEYRINEGAVFAIKKMLEEKLDTMTQTEAVECMIDILDNAMVNAQNRSRDRLKDILTFKTNDFEGFNEIDMQDIMPL